MLILNNSYEREEPIPAKRFEHIVFMISAIELCYHLKGSGSLELSTEIDSSKKRRGDWMANVKIVKNSYNLAFFGFTEETLHTRINEAIKKARKPRIHRLAHTNLEKRTKM